MPNTVRPMFAQYCVPAHIAHGSTVVTSVHGQSSAGDQRSAASRASTASAWLTLSTLPCSISTVAWSAATRSAPNGWWPASIACRASAWARSSMAATWVVVGSVRAAAAATLGGVVLRVVLMPSLARCAHAGRALLDHREQLVHRHRHRADDDQAGERQAHLHRRAGRHQQVADALVRRRHLRDRRADEGERDRDLERAEEVGHRARQADLDEHVPAASRRARAARPRARARASPGRWRC